ncbi:hypothetical protein AVEN_161135-1 [Araneus ventricosus]|uniref:Uncharacterized protein n=1 Tax=Araneus ventricosus TaxID=182803 RepID=A0A4Y2K6C3_ARAVE|nr:hypothetical protein AVEN_161135-1 [Araneus ventricosus]
MSFAPPRAQTGQPKFMNSSPKGRETPPPGYPTKAVRGFQKFRHVDFRYSDSSLRQHDHSTYSRKGVLTPQNACPIETVTDTMEEAASSSDSQYKALKDVVNFLSSLGLFTSDKGLLIALQYANEWKLAARPRRG